MRNTETRQETTFLIRAHDNNVQDITEIIKKEINKNQMRFLTILILKWSKHLKLQQRHAQQQ